MGADLAQKGRIMSEHYEEYSLEELEEYIPEVRSIFRILKKHGMRIERVDQEPDHGESWYLDG